MKMRNSFICMMMPPKTDQGVWYPLRLNFDDSAQCVVGDMSEILLAVAAGHKPLEGLTQAGVLHSPPDLGKNPPTQVKGYIVEDGELKKFNIDDWNGLLKERRIVKKNLRIAANTRAAQAKAEAEARKLARRA